MEGGGWLTAKICRSRKSWCSQTRLEKIDRITPRYGAGTVLLVCSIGKRLCISGRKTRSARRCDHRSHSYAACRQAGRRGELLDQLLDRKRRQRNCICLKTRRGSDAVGLGVCRRRAPALWRITASARSFPETVKYLKGEMGHEQRISRLFFCHASGTTARPKLTSRRRHFV